MAKFIVADLDGTLIKEPDMSLKQEFIEKIRKLTDCSNVFAVNSGRPYGYLKEYFEPIFSRTVFICNEGCQIMYKNCLIYKKTLPQKVVKEMCSGLDFEKFSPYGTLRETNQKLGPDILKMPALFGEDIFKLIFIKKSPECSDIARLKGKAEALGLRVCYEDNTYLEFCLKEANKGVATEFFKNKFSLRGEVIAFGDDERDFSMFDIATKAFLCKGKGNLSYPGAKLIDSAQDYIINEI